LSVRVVLVLAIGKLTLNGLLVSLAYRCHDCKMLELEGVGCGCDLECSTVYWRSTFGNRRWSLGFVSLAHNTLTGGLA
jgi:hypothetical protein